MDDWHYPLIFETQKYAAPEQLDSSQEQTCKIDIWSFGCIFFELLMGRPLFRKSFE